MTAIFSIVILMLVGSSFLVKADSCLADGQPCNTSLASSNKAGCCNPCLRAATSYDTEGSGFSEDVIEKRKADSHGTCGCVPRGQVCVARFVRDDVVRCCNNDICRRGPNSIGDLGYCGCIPGGQSCYSGADHCCEGFTCNRVVDGRGRYEGYFCQEEYVTL